MWCGAYLSRTEKGALQVTFFWQGEIPEALPNAVAAAVTGSSQWTSEELR